MSITDEFREWSERYTMRKDVYDELTAIADRIDKMHEDAMFDARTEVNGESYDAGFDAGFASADDWLGQHEDAMAEHGWYRALDADKKPIKFDDDVEWELLGSGETERGYVVGIKIDLIAGKQDCRVKVVRDSDFQTIELMAKNLHHVKPAEPEPTVEDLLRQFLGECEHASLLGYTDMPQDIFDTYVAKLQLKED